MPAGFAGGTTHGASSDACAAAANQTKQTKLTITKSQEPASMPVSSARPTLKLTRDGSTACGGGRKRGMRNVGAGRLLRRQRLRPRRAAGIPAGAGHGAQQTHATPGGARCNPTHAHLLGRRQLGRAGPCHHIGGRVHTDDLSIRQHPRREPAQPPAAAAELHTARHATRLRAEAVEDGVDHAAHHERPRAAHGGCRRRGREGRVVGVRHCHVSKHRHHCLAAFGCAFGGFIVSSASALGVSRWAAGAINGAQAGAARRAGGSPLAAPAARRPSPTGPGARAAAHLLAAGAHAPWPCQTWKGACTYSGTGRPSRASWRLAAAKRGASAGSRGRMSSGV